MNGLDWSVLVPGAAAVGLGFVAIVVHGRRRMRRRAPTEVRRRIDVVEIDEGARPPRTRETNP